MSYFMNLTDLAAKQHFPRPAGYRAKRVKEEPTGLVHATRRLFNRMRRDLELRESHRRLAELNDNLLKDIGLSRDAIHYLFQEND